MRSEIAPFFIDIRPELPQKKSFFERSSFSFNSAKSTSLLLIFLLLWIPFRQASADETSGGEGAPVVAEASVGPAAPDPVVAVEQSTGEAPIESTGNDSLPGGASGQSAETDSIEKSESGSSETAPASGELETLSTGSGELSETPTSTPTPTESESGPSEDQATSTPSSTTDNLEEISPARTSTLEGELPETPTSTPTSSEEIILENTGGTPIIPTSTEEDSESAPEKTPEEIEAEELSSPLADKLKALIRANLEAEYQARIQSYESDAERQREIIEKLKESDKASSREKSMNELKKGCLSLPDGSYYCVHRSSPSAGVEEKQNDGGRVVIEKDKAEGDSDVYYITPEGKVNFSNNSQEDSFPSIDPFNPSIVWQSFEGNRWQIYFGFVGATTTEKISPSEGNQMNAKISNGRIVWQEWVGGNWEVFLANSNSSGSSTKSVWSVERLTSNNTHDMFPSLAGDFLTWQTFEQGEWQVMLYDLNAKKMIQVSTGEGKHENPRVGVVWDVTYEDGQTKTLAYDLSSGEVSEVGNGKSIPLEEVPEPPLSEMALTTGSSSNRTASSSEQGE